MDAIKLLVTDHRTVDDLFKQAEDESPARQREVFKKVKGELDTHAHIEETIFYPTLQKKGNDDLKEIVAEGIEEHGQMKMFLGEMAADGLDDETFQAKFKVLMEDTRHHVKEEENEMFPEVRNQIPVDEIEAMGDKMQAEKQRFQKANGIKPVAPKQGVLEAAAATVSSLFSRLTGSDSDSSTKSAPRKSAGKPVARKSASKSTKGSSSSPKSSGKSGSKKSASKTSPKSPAKKASSGSSSSSGKSSAKSTSKAASSKSASKKSAPAKPAPIKSSSTKSASAKSASKKSSSAKSASNKSGSRSGKASSSGSSKRGTAKKAAGNKSSTKKTASKRSSTASSSAAKKSSRSSKK